MLLLCNVLSVTLLEHGWVEYLISRDPFNLSLSVCLSFCLSLMQAANQSSCPRWQHHRCQLIMKGNINFNAYVGVEKYADCNNLRVASQVNTVSFTTWIVWSVFY